VVGVKVPMQHYVLAVDKVRYAGEPVAVVVAQDRYIAEDALDLLRADYEALPAVVDIEAACDAGAAVLHEAVGSNVVSDRSFCYGDPDAAFAAARPSRRADGALPAQQLHAHRVALSSSPNAWPAARAMKSPATSWARSACIR
jgi:CO/xanthine dehydrogenase Mo-binding subunit